MVAVTDELAGSDGDIVTAAIQLLKIGTVVGARTWGGVIGIEGWHQLVDGTSMTMPKFSFWFSQFGWGVENYGVDPDVEVLMSPERLDLGDRCAARAGRQLAMEALAEQPAAAPPSTDARPTRRRPALPPRTTPPTP